MEITIGISNKHVHLTKEDYAILFGDIEFTKERDLTQYGEFASTLYVNLVTPKNRIDHVRVLGPIRNYTQIEISKTDSYFLGVNPPIRRSGYLDNSAPITIEGPRGTVYKECGCIIADRHIHVHTNDQEKYGLYDGDIVSVKVGGEKGGIMNNVHVKAGNFFYEYHIDTDDGNAHLLKNGDKGEVIK